ncbi:hypothetical protein C8Q80DRAFT_326763 [Daedaleopsis nitida]|nr:hypothetical protein C8Q80DRAFT_326763 [Daedaleopsis nitida]
MNSPHGIKLEPVDERLVFKYATIQFHCLHDIRNRLEHKALMNDSRMRLTKRAEEELRKHIYTPGGETDWEARIDLALRYLAQCEISGTNIFSGAGRALKILSEPCINPEHPSVHLDSDKTYAPPPPKLLGQARALAAYAYLKRYKASTEHRAEWRKKVPEADHAYYIVRDLFDAVTYARLAARSNFVPIVSVHATVGLRACARALNVRLHGYGRLEVLYGALLTRGWMCFPECTYAVPATLPLDDGTKKQLEQMLAVDDIVWETLPALPWEHEILSAAESVVLKEEVDDRGMLLGWSRV